jgi:hypothetical protein
MNPAEMIEALKGPDGLAHRQALQSRLVQMQIRLKLLMDQGASAHEFSQLESALLAVRAGLDTLSRLQMANQTPNAGPLVDSVRFISGEHS